MVNKRRERKEEIMTRRNKNSVRQKRSTRKSKLNSIILAVLFTIVTFSLNMSEIVAKPVEAYYTNCSPTTNNVINELLTMNTVEVSTADAIMARFVEVSDTVTPSAINMNSILYSNLVNNDAQMEYAIRCAYELGKKDAQEEHERLEAEKKAKEEKEKKEKERAEKKLQEEKDYYTEGFGRKSSIMSSSGLTAEQIDGITEGTKLHGLGASIKDIEDNYGVNAYFTLSVASLESSYGSSRMAINKNNIFGLLGKSFDSYSDCVYYFGNLMRIYKEDRHLDMSPAGINPTYCTDGSDWNGDVVSIMNTYVRKANKLY